MENNENKIEVNATDEPIIEQVEDTVVTEGGFSKEKLMDGVNTVKEKGLGLWNKFINAFRADPKKMGIALGAIVLAIAIVITSLTLIIGAATNSYKTPIKIMEKYENTKRYYTNYDRSVAMSNGFCEKEIKELAKLYKQTEDYKDDLEDAKDAFAEQIEDLKDEYGKNYKITYKIIDKEKLDKDDVRDYRDTLRDQGKTILNSMEMYEDYESDDWEDLADNLGFDGSKAKAKSYVKIMEKMGKNYKSAKVSAGYELTVVKTIKGSELDEPIEEELAITVYKVNGRWVKG